MIGASARPLPDEGGQSHPDQGGHRRRSLAYPEDTVTLGTQPGHRLVGVRATDRDLHDHVVRLRRRPAGRDRSPSATVQRIASGRPAISPR